MNYRTWEKSVLKNPETAPLIDEADPKIRPWFHQLSNRVDDRRLHRTLITYMLRLDELPAVYLAKLIVKKNPLILLVGEGNGGRYFNQFVVKHKDFIDAVNELHRGKIPDIALRKVLFVCRPNLNIEILPDDLRPYARKVIETENKLWQKYPFAKERGWALKEKPKKRRDEHDATFDRHHDD